jgi:hypothetical protein
MSKYQPVIICRTKTGEQETTATVYGAWAAHLALDKGARDYAITHVPSGLAIPREHTNMLSKAQAVEIAARIDSELGAKKPTKASSKRIVEIIHRVLTGATP